MIKIHHIEARRSERVVWLLEELGLPYQLLFKPGDVMGSLSMLQGVHPCAMAPTVVDGDDVLIESGAILETLLNRHGDGRLRPALATPEHARYLEWLHFAEGSFMPRMVQEAAQSRLPPSANAEASQRSLGATARILKYTDDTLAKSPYLAGAAFTAADINMHLPIRMGLSIAAGELGLPAAMLQPSQAACAPYPHVNTYLGRLAERPAFQRMMASTMPLGWPAF
jgi:glutathione S-transferase